MPFDLRFDRWQVLDADGLLRASCGLAADWLQGSEGLCDPRALNVVSYTALTGPALSVLGLDEDAIQVY